MSEYTITKEIKSQTKVGFGIYVFDFMFLVLFGIIAFSLRSMVNDHLLIPYAIFSATVALFLTSPSYFNRKRRNYQSLLLYLQRDDNLYRPVKNISREINIS